MSTQEEKKSETDVAPSYIEGGVQDADAQVVHMRTGTNSKLVLLTMWAGIASFTWGFTAAIIASSLGQPRFFTYFALDTASNAAGQIGAIVAVFNVAGVFGVFFAAYVCNRWGRKMGFIVAAFFTVFGAALSAGSVNVQMMVWSRLITGIGAWFYLLSAICYTQELAPATQRGVYGGTVGIFIMFGYVTAAFSGYGFFFYDSPVNWRVPLSLQVISPLVSLACVPFVPESPRWLESHGRGEEALAVLMSVHKFKRDPTFYVARAEYAQIKAQTALESQLVATWASMFRKYRKRTAAGLLVVVSAQFAGPTLLATYSPRIYGTLGFSPADSLLLSVGWLLFGTVLAVVTAFIADRVGRVKLLAYSVVGSGVSLAIEAALTARIQIATEAGEVASRQLQAGSAAMVFIWYCFFGFCEATLWLYIGEIYPNHVRIKGTSIALCGFNVFAVWITVAQPTGDQNIGWKFWLVLAIPAVITGILMGVVLPETKNVPLEEVGALFGDVDDVVQTPTKS